MKLMSESIGKVAAALVNAQKEMSNAVKDSKNPYFKSSYADLNAIREAVLPACNNNGISVLQSNVFFEGKKFVQTIALHESGEYISGITEILSVKETDAQAQGSGISYARRYGLQSLFNVGAEDDDGNSASGKTAPAIRTPAKSEASANLGKAGVIEGAATSTGTVSSSTDKASGDQKGPTRKSFRDVKAGSEDL